MTNKKKNATLPTNAAEWDAKTRLRWLASMESRLRKVPIGIRAQCYQDLQRSVANELVKESDQMNAELVASLNGLRGSVSQAAPEAAE